LDTSVKETQAVVCHYKGTEESSNSVRIQEETLFSAVTKKRGKCKLSSAVEEGLILRR
jgi:hypothetical protein